MFSGLPDFSSSGRPALRSFYFLGRTRRDRAPAPYRTHRRCDRRRGRASRFHHRVLPGEGRARRAAPGEDQLPQGEGLRRRPHTTRHQAARVDGHRHLRGGRLAPQQGAADHRRRRPPPARLAGSRLLPGLRTRPQARRLRRAARPPGPEGGRPAVRALQRGRADRRRPHGPYHRGARQARRREAGSHLPRPAGGGGRRQLHPALPRDGPAPSRGPPDGRRGPYVLHLPAPRRRLSGVLAGAVGQARPGRGPSPARLRLDLRHGGRHVQRRSGRPQHLRRLQGAGLARRPQGLVRVHARGVGLHPREHDRAHPRRRPPDGLQPATPLHQGAAARRRQPAAW